MQRQQRSPAKSGNQATARRSGQRQSASWQTAGVAAARRLRPVAGAPVARNAVPYRQVAQTLCRRVALAEQPSAEDAAIQSRAPMLEMDDIDRACADECSAIMQDFARRLAGARSPGERRAIKTARKSALAAARQKAKLAKAARKGANKAARQSAPRRQPKPRKPRR
jgi:hypothetical protein